MRKLYVSPKVWAVTISTNAMIAGSWDKDDTSGVNPTPGGQGSFGAKEEDSSFGW
mgnify:CR=1 FL=1